MAEARDPGPTRARARYHRDSPEFGRVVSLSDAVFAIAMTLLVLTLDVPAVAPARLGAALADQVPQLAAFALAFALVANIWWQHHKLFALLGSLEAGLVGLNLALLGVVALVPYPTSLVGSAPTARAAVLLFIATFVLLNLLHLALVLRAQAAAAWQQRPSQRLFYWLVFTWIAGIAVLALAAGLTLWRPTAGLVVLVVSIALGPVAARRSLARRGPSA